MPVPSQKKIAIVLSGGGARGAYEAGIIHYIRTMLPKSVSERHFDIHCGASVGAINTAFLAATAHDSKLQGELIWKLWTDVREDNI
ncbi:MAG: patatin-like phospholipase family protein, partial [Deltaproteobacteria bacterium]|nr:patatin-like phospholipase family protein [Deltaproteobacteria bacterium]